MGRKRNDDDEADDYAPPPGLAEQPAAWVAVPVAKQVQDILDALEAPSIDKDTRWTLQRYLWRRQKFGDTFRDAWGNDGRGYITLLVRTIVESEGNRDALIEPVVSAVSSCMRPQWTGEGLAWIEAFDRIDLKSLFQTMRELKCFTRPDMSMYLARAISSWLWEIFGPDVVPAPPKPKPRRKAGPTQSVEES